VATERLEHVDDERSTRRYRLAGPEERDEIVLGQVGRGVGDRFTEMLGAKPSRTPLFGVPLARHEETGARKRRELSRGERKTFVGASPKGIDRDESIERPRRCDARARTLDWGATPIGWPDGWTPALRIAARAMLDSPFPICLWCGPSYALVYNDAYRRGLAAQAPAALGPPGNRFHEIRRVVSDLCVFDFETDDGRMRIRSLHPGVTVDQVQEATGFDLVVPDDVGESRLPTPDELELLGTVIDPAGTRYREVPDPA
jgi:hypothetical protein